MDKNEIMSLVQSLTENKPDIYSIINNMVDEIGDEEKSVSDVFTRILNFIDDRKYTAKNKITKKQQEEIFLIALEIIISEAQKEPEAPESFM